MLDVWEQGRLLGSPGRALLLLRSTVPEAAAEALAGLSVGERDRLLLEVRERWFGPELVCLAECPACGSSVELPLSVDELRASASEATGELRVEEGDIEVEFRVPNSHDLLALAGSATVGEAREVLLDRCVAVSRGDGSSLRAAELPPELLATVAARMAAADPQADLQLAIRCPECDEEWTVLFDIAAVLWTELDAWARRTLREVDLLARAYGWGEREILSLGAGRRRLYLELGVA